MRVFRLKNKLSELESVHAFLVRALKVFLSLLVSNFYACFAVCISLALISTVFLQLGYTLVFLVGILIAFGASLPGLIFIGYPIVFLVDILGIRHRGCWLLIGGVTSLPCLYSLLHFVLNTNDISALGSFRLGFLIFMAISIGIVTASNFQSDMYGYEKP